MNSTTLNFSPNNARALAFLRISVGILFLIFGQYKVLGAQFTLHGGFQFWINRFLQDGAYPFIVPALRGFVLPHATPIAFLVAYGELAIGLALLVGVCVRPASAFGLLFMLTLLFSSNYPGPHAPLWQYFGASLDHSVLALCFVAFLTGRSDSIWSLRARLMSERDLAVGRLRRNEASSKRMNTRESASPGTRPAA
jgi:thiosulfate dehydrogenase (quinone) large subunit